MREILFRGKPAKIQHGVHFYTDEWVYGGAVCYEKHRVEVFDETKGYILKPHIVDWQKTGYTIGEEKYHLDCVVIPETIGQFTGLTDKNGVKIFESDIIGSPYAGENNFGLIVTYLCNTNEGLGMWCGWYLQHDKWERFVELEADSDLEVIGNIHDNKELLEGSK